MSSPAAAHSQEWLCPWSFLDEQLAQIGSSAFAGEYRMRAVELHKWVDPLTDEQFWRNPYTYGNSVGHLVLHLTGNPMTVHSPQSTVNSPQPTPAVSKGC